MEQGKSFNNTVTQIMFSIVFDMAVWSPETRAHSVDKAGMILIWSQSHMKEQLCPSVSVQWQLYFRQTPETLAVELSDILAPISDIDRYGLFQILIFVWFINYVVLILVWRMT